MNGRLFWMPPRYVFKKTGYVIVNKGQFYIRIEFYFSFFIELWKTEIFV